MVAGNPFRTSKENRKRKKVMSPFPSAAAVSERAAKEGNFVQFRQNKNCPTNMNIVFAYWSLFFILFLFYFVSSLALIVILDLSSKWLKLCAQIFFSWSLFLEIFFSLFLIFRSSFKTTLQNCFASSFYI